MLDSPLKERYFYCHHREDLDEDPYCFLSCLIGSSSFLKVLLEFALKKANFYVLQVLP